MIPSLHPAQGNPGHLAMSIIPLYVECQAFIFFLGLVEGKDKLPHLPQEYSDLGSSIGLIPRYTKSPYGTGKIVVLDSGFCLLKGVVEMKKEEFLQLY